MFILFHKTDFTWSNVETLEEVENIGDYLVDPIYAEGEFERCQEFGPRLWVFFKSGDPEVDTIRSFSDEEMDTGTDFVLAAKIAKIEELSQAAADNIVGGFTSNALGFPKIYDSKLEDQTNLIGSVTATSPSAANPDGTSSYYATRDPVDGTKSYLPHTHDQLRQVLDDGATIKLYILQAFAMLRYMVELQTTVSAINAYTWSHIDM